MDGQEFERMLRRLMACDTSGGSDAFQEVLLERCLAVLDADEGCSPVDEEDLDLLSAAGDLSVACRDATWPKSR